MQTLFRNRWIRGPGGGEDQRRRARARKDTGPTKGRVNLSTLGLGTPPIGFEIWSSRRRELRREPPWPGSGAGVVLMQADEHARWVDDVAAVADSGDAEWLDDDRPAVCPHSLCGVRQRLHSQDGDRPRRPVPRRE